MPHIIVEYSKNLNSALDVEALVEALHVAAMGLEALPTGGLRTRAHQAGIARIGDGEPSRNFIYLTVRLGQGRSSEVKRDIGDKLFSVLTGFTADHFDAGNGLSLGLEIQEIEKDWTWKKNNIHQILKDEN